MLHIYKKPQLQTICCAVEDVKHAERVLGGLVAYCHVTQEVNCVADDMAHRALATEGDVTYMHGEVPGNTPFN